MKATRKNIFLVLITGVSMAGSLQAMPGWGDGGIFDMPITPEEWKEEINLLEKRRQKIEKKLAKAQGYAIKSQTLEQDFEYFYKQIKKDCGVVQKMVSKGLKDRKRICCYDKTRKIFENLKDIDVNKVVLRELNKSTPWRNGIRYTANGRRYAVCDNRLERCWILISGARGRYDSFVCEKSYKEDKIFKDHAPFLVLAMGKDLIKKKRFKEELKRNYIEAGLKNKRPVKNKVQEKVDLEERELYVFDNEPKIKIKTGTKRVATPKFLFWGK